MRIPLGFALALSLCAQTAPPAQQPLPADFAGLGAGYESSLSHHVVPWAAYGHQFSANMFSFTEAQVVSFSRHPLQAQTVLTTGMCAVNKFIGKSFDIGGCVEGGVANANSNVGGVFGGTPFGVLRLGKAQHFGVFVAGDFTQSALDGLHTSVKIGLLYGWGK